MGESLIQRYFVRDEGHIGRKSFSETLDHDKSFRRSPGKLRASSRGKTKGASVIRNDWAYRACRRI